MKMEKSITRKSIPYAATRLKVIVQTFLRCSILERIPELLTQQTFLCLNSHITVKGQTGARFHRWLKG
jgi:hypothetical protein